jgi:hypothetical protein
MLSAIRQAIDSAGPQVAPQVTPQVRALLVRMAKQKNPASRDELLQSLALSDRKSFRERYLKPALDADLIEMTLPDRPNSRLQQYRLTGLGKTLIERR